MNTATRALSVIGTPIIQLIEYYVATNIFLDFTRYCLYAPFHNSLKIGTCVKTKISNQNFLRFLTVLKASSLSRLIHVSTAGFQNVEFDDHSLVAWRLV
jgi:hypothetical protein